MGIFKKSEEQKARRQQVLDELAVKQDASDVKEQDKNESKAREKAAKARIDVDGALYVFWSFINNDDEKGTLNEPLGIIFNDRIVKVQARWSGNSNEEVLIKSITSIETSKGLLPILTIYASGNKMTFQLSQAVAKKVTSIVRDLGSDSHNLTENSNAIDQLSKLAELLERGLVTQEEFDKKKIELLGL